MPAQGLDEDGRGAKAIYNFSGESEEVFTHIDGRQAELSAVRRAKDVIPGKLRVRRRQLVLVGVDDPGSKGQPPFADRFDNAIEVLLVGHLVADDRLDARALVARQVRRK